MERKKAQVLKNNPGRTVLIAVLILLALATSSFAGTTGWSGAAGTYVPPSGTFSEGVVSATTSPRYRYWSRVTFRFSSSNVTAITDYNNGGDNPGDRCDNAKAYFTVEHEADPDSWDLELNAYLIYTNLPNATLDFDGGIWAEAHEAEATALGVVTSSQDYYMRTYWEDLRDGDAGDNGRILIELEMSKKGLTEYNPCYRSGVLVDNPYGARRGSL